MNIPRFLRAAMAACRLSSPPPRWAHAWALASYAALLPLGATALAQTLDPRAVPQETVNTADASEVFLKAYTSVQQADKLEQEGKRAPALAKYRFAASLLEQLTQSNPNWQPLIVKYRLRNTTDTIRHLEEKGTLQAATPAPGMAARPGSHRRERRTTRPGHLRAHRQYLADPTSHHGEHCRDGSYD